MLTIDLLHVKTAVGDTPVHACVLARSGHHTEELYAVSYRIVERLAMTVTKNEILTALNKPEQFILAIVLVGGGATTTYYRLEPFAKEPDLDAISSNYDLHGLLTHAERMEA